MTFIHAVVDAIRQLDERDYDPRGEGAIVYSHPETVRDALSELNEFQVGEPLQVHGLTIERTPNLPKDVVVVVHLDAMRLGPDAIAFAEVDND